ncbi:MAG: hypothetical protein ACTSRW_01510 [Candidatus Helarchaeota archaeon]
MRLALKIFPFCFIFLLSFGFVFPLIPFNSFLTLQNSLINPDHPNSEFEPNPDLDLQIRDIEVQHDNVSGSGNLIGAVKFAQACSPKKDIFDNSTFQVENHGWNATYVNVTISNVYGIENTIGEMDLLSSENILYSNYRQNNYKYYYQPFQIPETCNLTQISVYLLIDKLDASGDDLEVRIFNAKNPGFEEPDSEIHVESFNLETYEIGVSRWVTVNFVNPVVLNATETVSNTFYICLVEANTNADFGWWGARDNSDGDNDNEFKVWRWYFIMSVFDWDFSLNTTLMIERNVTDISLQINGTAVTKTGDRMGEWTKKMDPPTNETMLFNITANEIFSCDIISITNITYSTVFNSNFYVGADWDYSEWNVTGSVTFGTGFLNNGINVTIPNWNVENVMINESLHLNWEVLPSSSQVVRILDSQNGTWNILCNSSNFIHNATIELGGVPVQSAFANKTVDIYANFTSYLNDGNANLTVFPIGEGNFSRSKAIVGNLSAEFGSWDINETITNNTGTFYIHIFWSNGSEVGFNRTQFTVISLPSNISYISHNDQLDAGDYVYVFFSYIDNETGNDISGATVTLKNGTDGSDWQRDYLLTQFENGTYRCRLSTTGLKGGISHNVAIIALGRIHQPASIYITFVVSGGIANVTITSGLLIEDGKHVLDPNPFVNTTTSFKIYYYNETIGGLEGARIEADEWVGETISSTDLGLGNYEVFVSTYGLHADNNYTLVVTVQSIGFDPIFLNITIPVHKIPTRIDIPNEYDNLQKYRHEQFDLIIHYYDTFHESSIPQAVPEEGGNVTCSLETLDLTMTRIISTAGFYKATIDLSRITTLKEDTEYNITVKAHAFDFESATVNISIFIKVKINATITLIDPPTDVLQGKSFSISARLALTNGTPIINVPVKFLITYYPSASVVETVELTDENGTTSTIIDSYSGHEDISIIVMYFGNNTYNPVNSTEINVSVTILTSKISISAVPSILETETLLVTFILLYGNNSPIVGGTISVEINMGNLGIRHETASTNEQGKAIISISLLTGSQRIIITATYNGETYITGDDQDFTVTIVPLVAYVTTQAISYAPIWVPLLAALIGIPLLVQFGYRRPKKKKMMRIWKNTEQKFKDIANIEYLLIVFKDSGLNIYNYSFKGETLNYELMGGFLTAVNLFQGEMVEKKDEDVISEDHFELKFKKFIIYVQFYKELMGIFICDEVPSDGLKNRCRQFLGQFRIKFGKHITDFQGQINVFEPAGELVLKHFDLMLMYPHVLKPMDDNAVKGLKGLEAAIYNAAKAIVNQNRYFFIPSLIETISPVRKEPRVQILHIIHGLHAKGIFKAITFEEAAILYETPTKVVQDDKKEKEPKKKDKKHKKN